MIVLQTVPWLLTLVVSTQVTLQRLAVLLRTAFFDACRRLAGALEKRGPDGMVDGKPRAGLNGLGLAGSTFLRERYLPGRRTGIISSVHES